MIELSFLKLINHQRRTASPLALRMLLEKNRVSKRKLIFFALACCFFCERERVFSLGEAAFFAACAARSFALCNKMPL